MRTFFTHLKGNRCIFMVTLLVGIWYCANSVLIPILMGELITAVVNDLSVAGRIISLYLGIYFAQLFLCQLDTFMSRKFKIRQRMTMRNRAYEAYSGGKTEVGQEELASFVSYLNNDLPAVVEQYFAGTIDIFKCVCLILLSAVSILSIHWILALEILIFSVMIVCFPTLLRGRGDRARRAVSEAMSGYNGRLQSFLGGLPVIQSYGYRNRSIQFMRESNQEIAVREAKQLQCQIAVYGTTAFLQHFKSGLLLLTSVALVSKGVIGIGSLVTVLQLSSLLGAPIEVLASLRHARNEVGALLARYEKILEEVPNPDTIPSGESDGKLRELCIKNLSYAINGIPILENISYTFRAGEKYLITGESGSGKSTLMRLLSRTLDCRTDRAYCHPDGEGMIFYNKTDADKLPVSVYDRHICPVFQEPYLFFTTLRENIMLGRDIPDSVYQETIAKLHLSYLLERYEGQEISPQIVEQLSGGEKQRIALARAMVGRPDAYLCDEVTSALDEENAENVERILLEEAALAIMISHKPSAGLFERYTAHLVMEKGNLKEVQQVKR